MIRSILVSSIGLLSLCAMSAGAAPVVITISGTVEFNQIGSGPLAGATSGDSAVMTFRVDSDTFTDSASFPTRGYDIDPSSFSFTAGGGSVGLGADPAYFVIRDNDPAVDGFFVSTSVDFPLGVPSDSPGVFGPFSPNFSVTYLGDTLAGLDILAAVGDYDFTGLTVFNYTVDDGPFNAMGIVFENLSIAVVPLPAAAWLLLSGIGCLLVSQRRRG